MPRKRQRRKKKAKGGNIRAKGGNIRAKGGNIRAKGGNTRAKRRKSQGPWYCYTLHGCRATGLERTYVGKTNHMTRRIAQHNGKRKGGARQTRRHRPHSPFVIVTGFPSERTVLQFEWAMKHRRASGARGRTGRVQTIEKLMCMPKWCSTAPHMATLSLTVLSTLSRTAYRNMCHTKTRDTIHDTCNVRYVFDLTPRQLVQYCTPT